jgi:hypothetical protein
VTDVRYDVEELRIERLARLQTAMRRHGVDVCVLSNEPNVRSSDVRFAARPLCPKNVRGRSSSHPFHARLIFAWLTSPQKADREEGRRRRPTVRRWVIAGIGAVLITAAIGGAFAFAGNDSEGSVTGGQADRAIHAALEATGGGTANAVERDSENGGSWEVEVKKPDGAIVDVRLNADYSVLMVEGDNETPDTNDASS